MISSLPGVKYGAAHYKNLEQDKTNAPKISKGCYDAMMILSPQLITDGQWWYNKLNCSKTLKLFLMLSNFWQQIFPLKHL